MKRKKSTRKVGKKVPDGSAWSSAQPATSMTSSPVVTPRHTLDSESVDSDESDINATDVMLALSQQTKEQRGYFRSIQKDLSVVSTQVAGNSGVTLQRIKAGNAILQGALDEVNIKLAYVKTVCERNERTMNNLSNWSEADVVLAGPVGDDAKKCECCTVQ